MQIEKDLNNDSLELVLVGRLDTLTSFDLEKEIENLPDNITELILDFSKLDYISSAGLRILTKTLKKMDSVSGNLRIRNVNKSVMSIFKMTGFDTILTIE